MRIETPLMHVLCPFEAQEIAERRLQGILAKVEGSPLALNETIATLREMVPQSESLLSVPDMLKAQESTSSTMANHLHGLTSHYDEMATALRDSEAGIEIGDEDFLGKFYDDK